MHRVLGWSADLNFTTQGKKELSEQKENTSFFLVWADFSNIFWDVLFILPLALES